MLQLSDRNLSAKTRILAVIGDPIGHSMSPKMHNAALLDQGLDYVYVAFHVKKNQLQQAVDGFRALDIRGANVTIPHKVEIMKYLDEIEDTAEKIGAVNTVINENGRLIGRNTDGEGAVKAIRDKGIDLQGKKVILIGAGGSAKAIGFHLCKSVNELVIMKRNHNFIQAELLQDSLKAHYDIPISSVKTSAPHNELKAIFATSDIIVNTTPVGMYPHQGISPIPEEFIFPHHFAFDLVYNPLETEFLSQARKKGCAVLSGIDMLVNQGAIAYEFWTGKFPDTDIMKQAAVQHLEGNKK